MNTFIRAFADYLTPFTASIVPEIFTPPGKPIDESRYGILILESTSELIPGNRTMDLSLSLEIRFHLSEQGAFVAADTDAVETGLYNALSTALGELVQYMPLPGQPDGLQPAGPWLRPGISACRPEPQRHFPQWPGYR